jgi:hypothetical protein
VRRYPANHWASTDPGVLGASESTAWTDLPNRNGSTAGRYRAGVQEINGDWDDRTDTRQSLLTQLTHFAALTQGTRPAAAAEWRCSIDT